MSKILNRFTASVSRFLARLRYRIEWKGFDELPDTKGILFLPNHPAEIDPVLVIGKLWNRYQPRPFVVEDFYHMPVLNILMRSVRALPVPDMQGAASMYKRRRLQHTLETAMNGLKSGDNVLLYPAGRLMRDNVESLQATSAVHDIIQANPDVKICVIRTRGLLGSSFAWLTHKQRPDLGEALKSAAFWICANLIFFTPRRKLTIEAAMLPDDFPRDADKLTMNRWLENWYNEQGPEEISLVSYSRWSQVLHEVTEVHEEETEQKAEIPDEVAERVKAALKDISGQKNTQIRPNMKLINDLGLDSLNMADVVAWLEEEFQVMDVDPADLKSVNDVMAAAVGVVRDSVGEPVTRTPEAWLDPAGRPALMPADENANIPYNFLKCCDRMGNHPAIADATSILTYSRLKLGTMVLAEVFKEYEEEHLGIMLPASVAADVTVMAAMLAGKVPVMINWTLGEANLKHVLEVSGIKRIITASRFLDKLDTINFELIDDYIVPLEDLRREISLGAKLRAMLNKGKSPAAIAQRYGCSRFSPDDRAVILFTSGSESVPKGVPLSHRNIMADFNGSIATAQLTGKDCIYGFLPPFHSFGFTVTTIMPLLMGFKACYYPNPTESRKLVRDCERWKPTCCAGTPTFFAGIFKAADASQLESLHMMVSGAEKAPATLFETAAELGIKVLEGYGITETAPVLTLNPPDQPRVGVGQAIGDVQLLIVNPDTRKPLPTGERGLILARGTNVFKGYLHKDSSDAFCEVDGHEYYVTGDLGFLDEKGNLTIAGRLKRFVKIGGEMISLPAMEEAISAKWPAVDGEMVTAIAPWESEHERPQLYLFNTLNLDVQEVNNVLRDAGFANLARLSDAFNLPTIPLLGTGKTDYQTLKATLTKKLTSQE